MNNISVLDSNIIMFKQVLREGTPPPRIICVIIYLLNYILMYATSYKSLLTRTISRYQWELYIYIYTHKNYHSSYIISTEYRGIHFRLKLIVLHVCYFHNGPEVETIKRCEQLSNKINLVLAEKKCKIELWRMFPVKVFKKKTNKLYFQDTCNSLVLRKSF